MVPLPDPVNSREVDSIDRDLLPKSESPTETLNVALIPEAPAVVTVIDLMVPDMPEVERTSSEAEFLALPIWRPLS